MSASGDRMSNNRERGTAALEVVGTLPALLLSMVVALQIGVVGWTVVETAQAAEAGARARSVDRNPTEAARNSLGGVLEPSFTDGTLDDGGYRYTLEVEIPTVLPFSVGSVTRSAVMPVVVE